MISDDLEASASAKDGQVKTVQIIAGALMAGIGSFGVIAMFVRRSGPKGLLAADPWDVMPPGGVISLIALVLAATVAVVSFVVPNVVVAGARRTLAAQKDADKSIDGLFESIFTSQMIVGMAILEGGAFFNLIAFMIEGHIPNLIAAGVLLLLIAARFPSRSKLDTFCEDQRALLIEERRSA